MGRGFDKGVLSICHTALYRIRLKPHASCPEYGRGGGEPRPYDCLV